jgi:hypothetical protein
MVGMTLAERAAAGARRGSAAARSVARHEALDRRAERQSSAGYAALLSRRPAGPQPIQRANRTGLPDGLRAGVEALSGMSLEGVKVHYNSARPAELDALAYAQGTDIHLAPGQERHLPHEAWHVVQQAQGRVKPTMQIKDGVPVNDDAGLEREADQMGRRTAEAEPPAFASKEAGVHPPRRAAGGTESRVVQGMFELAGKEYYSASDFGEQTAAYKAVKHSPGLLRAAIVLAGDGEKSPTFKTPKNLIEYLEKNYAEVIAAPEEDEDEDDEEEQVQEGKKERKTSAKEGEGRKKASTASSSSATHPEIFVSNEFGEKPLTTGLKFTSFETPDLGTAHLEKHGPEFGVETKAAYLKLAKEFAADGSKKYCEAIIDGTTIKVDPDVDLDGEETRRVLITNNNLLRTFYVWDPAFSSDPFAYAIFYTITHNRKMSIRSLNPETMEMLEDEGVDLFAMEKEVIDHELQKGSDINTIERETLAPRWLIVERRTYGPMERAMSEVRI